MFVTCNSCKFRGQPIDSTPCVDCDGNYKEWKWRFVDKPEEPVEPWGEPEEAVETEEVKDCNNCKHQDLYWTESPCNVCEGFTSWEEENEEYATTECGEFSEDEPEEDVVNHPKHYNTYGMEAIDVIQNSMTTEEFKGYLKGNAMKYMIRYELKGVPLQDLSKAIWYMNKLKEVIEDESSNSREKGEQ